MAIQVSHLISNVPCYNRSHLSNEKTSVKRLWIGVLTVAIITGAHAQSQTATVHGRVIDQTGKAVSIFVSVDGLGIGNQGAVATGLDGSYSLKVPIAPQYIVSLSPARSIFIDDLAFPSAYLADRKLAIRSGSDVEVNFTANAAGTLWLKAYGANGTLLYYKDFLSSQYVGAYPLGVLPYGKSIEASSGSIPMFWGWINNSNELNTCLLLPPAKPFAVWALWRLPVVGTTFLHADNGGQGFLLETGKLKAVNLVFEFAATELRDLQSRINAARSAGYTLSAQVSSLAAQATTLFGSAQTAQQAGNESGAAATSYLVLSNVVQAREQLTLEEAAQDIEKYRRSNVTVSVVDQNGLPIPSANVSYRQVSHDFAFAVGYPQSQQLAMFRNAGFESVGGTGMGWWGQAEPSDGVFLFPDSAVSLLASANLQPVMHSSIWPTWAFAGGFPSYTESYSPAQLIPKAYRFGNQMAGRYAGKLVYYNAFNEPDLDLAFPFTLPDLVNMISASARGARQADPSLRAYVNLGIPVFFSGNFDAVRYQTSSDLFGNRLPQTSYPTPAASPLDVAQQLATAGSDVNTTGLEFYNGVVAPPIDLSLFADTLQLYGAVGNPLFLSELSYATLDDYPGLSPFWKAYGGWHQGYTDAAQSDWASDTITIAFSKPFVSGIQWFAAEDGPPNYDYVGDGLLHADRVSPRPALLAIQKLLQAWTTAGGSTTDSKGQLSFRGFGGMYNITVDANGKKGTYQRHISEGGSNAITLQTTATPSLVVSASSVQLSCRIHAALPSQTLNIENSGGGTLSWTASGDSSWIALLQSGSIAPSRLTVAAKCDSLSPGIYVGSVTISSPGLAAQRLPVSLTVQPALGSPELGWWWDSKLSGTGFFIEYGGKSGNGLFAGGFLYDASGNSTWLASTGQMSGSTFASTWSKVSGGQSLTGPYKAPSATSAGSLGLSFTDSTHAVMTRPDGSQINLSRFSFTGSTTPAAPIAGAPQSGWWWAGSSLSGTGYGIEIQGSNVFIVAYVYDDAGNPVWYLATGSLSSPTSYSGTWDLYSGGPQLTSPEGTYSASKVAGKSVAMSLAFSDATHGTLTMGSVSIPIVRFQEF